VWSEKYDHPLDDIFAIQNEVTQRIAASLGGSTLAMAEAAKAKRKPPGSLQAYDYYLLAGELMLRENKDSYSQAVDFAKKAIDLDPQFARAYVLLARAYDVLAYIDPGQEDPPAIFKKEKDLLMKAIALDPNDPSAYTQLGLCYGNLGDYDRAIPAFEQAFSMNPNDPQTLSAYGEQLTYVGRAKEGVELVERAFRLNPNRADLYDGFADPYYAAGRYEQAITMLRRRTDEPGVWSQMVLAMSYAQSGRKAEAAAAVADLQRRFPDNSFERIMSDFGLIPDQSTFEHYLDGARKAGLPDCATQAELQKMPKMIHLAVCDAKRATH
jgi:tetratricopeptide (TPR) repeat protein